MRCAECRRGRRFAVGSVYCRLYGMIIREDHECGMKGGLRREGNESDRHQGEDETELQEDGAGAAGRLQIVL